MPSYSIKPATDEERAKVKAYNDAYRAKHGPQIRRPHGKPPPRVRCQSCRRLFAQAAQAGDAQVCGGCRKGEAMRARGRAMTARRVAATLSP